MASSRWSTRTLLRDPLPLGWVAKPQVSLPGFHVCNLLVNHVRESDQGHSVVVGVTQVEDTSQEGCIHVTWDQTSIFHTRSHPRLLQPRL